MSIRDSGPALHPSVLVGGFTLSYHNKETVLSIIDPPLWYLKYKSLSKNTKSSTLGISGVGLRGFRACSLRSVV